MAAAQIFTCVGIINPVLGNDTEESFRQVLAFI
jgi:hypothetical protein